MSIPPAKIILNDDKIEKTKLKSKYIFYYRIFEEQQSQKITKEEYEKQIKPIAEFDSIEDFWAIFQHLR